MSNDMVFSLIASAVREYGYQDFYDSFSKDTKVKFEIIFVGDNPPKKEIPENFNYIETSVKPSQCLEIAARNACGKYLIPVCDDYRVECGFLDRVYNWVSRVDDDKVFVGFRHKHVNREIQDIGLCLDLSIKNSPIIGQSGVYRKDLWHKLGGIDNRFIYYLCDFDVQMRFFEYGMNIFIAPDCILIEHDVLPQCKDRTFLKNSEEKFDKMSFYDLLEKQSLASPCLGRGAKSRRLLRALWGMPDGRILNKRLSPVCSFEDKNILFETQGTK
jgi:hypothetical protein